MFCHDRYLIREMIIARRFEIMVKPEEIKRKLIKIKKGQGNAIKINQSAI